MVMKRQIDSKKPLLWGLVALVAGILITIYSEQVTELIVKVIGLTIAAMGLIEVISSYAKHKKQEKPVGASMYIAVVALVAGIVIFAKTEVLVNFLMFLIGAFVMLMAIFQLVGLVKLRKLGARVSPFFYIFSILFLASGVVMVLYPIQTNDWIVKFAGIWIAAFGLSEILNVSVIRVPEAQVIESKITVNNK